MFSYSGLGFSVIICCEKNYYYFVIILLKKAFENNILKVIQVIFNKY